LNSFEDAFGFPRVAVHVASRVVREH